MALLNPVYALVLPFLCIFTIPLAIFAGITTTLAFSVLMMRVAVVYLDMVLALFPQYIAGQSGTYPRSLTADYYQQSGWEQPVSPTGSIGSAGWAEATSRGGGGGGGGGALAGSQTTPGAMRSYSVPGSVTGGAFAGSAHRSPKHRANNPAPFFPTGSGSTIFIPAGPAGSVGASGRRSRRSSQVSMASISPITPIRGPADEGDATTAPQAASSRSGSVSGLAAMTRTTSTSGLAPSVGIVRDFEGVGGWRLLGADGDDGDDSDWAKINRRLELPHERAPSRHHNHHQHRQSQSMSASLSGGATTPVDALATSWLMMKSLRKEGS